VIRGESLKDVRKNGIRVEDLAIIEKATDEFSLSHGEMVTRIGGCSVEDDLGSGLDDDLWAIDTKDVDGMQRLVLTSNDLSEGDMAV